jgi:hypothetical protein
MAYLQKFGINRNTPMNMVAPMKMVGGEDNQASNVVEKQNKKAVEEKSSSWFDGISDALTVAGMVAINTVANLGAAGYSALTGGDTGKYLTNAALAGGAMIPGVGQGVSGTKLAAKVLPKTVKAVKGLDKSSKVLKTGKIAKNIKKGKGAGIIGTNTGIISSIDRDEAMANKSGKSGLYM